MRRERIAVMLATACFVTSLISPAAAESSWQPQTVGSYEAEDGSFTGNVRVEKKGSVTGFEQDGDSCTVTVQITEAGFYDLEFMLKSLGGYKENYVLVDGNRLGTVYADGSKFMRDTIRRVYLEAGEHSVAVSKYWGYILWDKVNILTSEPFDESVYQVSAKLINENATDNARRLFRYRDGKAGFWPGAAWIASTNADYDWDGSVGSTLEFETAYVQWPVGPSGNQETNKGKFTAGAFWMIPNGVEDPKFVYNVFEAVSNWYHDDVSIRDDKETMWWWYAVTAGDEDLQEENFQVMFDMGTREQFDLWDSVNVEMDLESLIRGDMTAAQMQETYRQQYQDGLDGYFG